jgi:hypothetical protein
MQEQISGTPTNLTDDGIVSESGGNLLGFYVNSTNAGTVVIYNGTSADGTAISGTITPAIGWHEFAAYCPAGCFFEIAGTALDVTAIFAAG